MLPREVVEELLGRSGSTGLHVLVALPDTLYGFLIVLALPFEIVSKDIVKGIGSAFPPAASQILELRQAPGFQRHRFHGFQQYPMSSPGNAPSSTMLERKAKSPQSGRTSVHGFLDNLSVRRGSVEAALAVRVIAEKRQQF